MEYRAVGNRCAVDLSLLKLPIDNNQATAILRENGFSILDVDIFALAQQCVGVSQYFRGAKPNLAPKIVDCSSLIKWLFAQKGIWLPRRSIQQRELGYSVALNQVISGDLIFTSGEMNYFIDDPNDGVGHVGMVLDQKTVIHATKRENGVTVDSLEKFLENRKFRGIRRYINEKSTVLTIEVPENRQIETADDFRWIIPGLFLDRYREIKT
jgi:hypothetical protein